MEKKAEQMFYARVEYAYLEFGTKTAQKWQADRILIEHQLRLYPESFTPERLLVDRKRLYRSCHIMDRFKKFITMQSHLTLFTSWISGTR